MNQLSYLTSDENGLSFQLLVDGRGLGELIGADNPWIPYWLIVDDLPYWPPFGDSEAKLRTDRIVCVCSCGEYGCGHTRCQITRTDEGVTFHDFALEVSDEGKRKVFTFSHSNFDQIVRDIVEKAEKERRKAAEPGATDNPGDAQ